MVPICIYRCYCSGIGKRTGFQETDQKMNAKTEAVKIEFSFENDVTIKDLQSIEKKAATVQSNLPVDSTMNIFHNRFSIEVVITWNGADASRREFGQMNTIFTRFINSHKQPATYGWNTASQLAVA
jgi:hypothetical protein